jgi:glutamate synthase (NADPH/NADH) small chain
LKSTTKALLNGGLTDTNHVSAKGKNVVIVGGGDTGNDCVGTCIRHGCKSVLQLEMMPKLPDERSPDNEWPQWPKVCKTDYGQQEAIAVFGQDPRVYQTTVKKFLSDKDENLTGIITVKLATEKDPSTGRMNMVEVAGSEEERPCELLLIAAGFLGPDPVVAQAFGAQATPRSTVATKDGGHQTSAEKVFTAGDMHIGQSLVVRAIAEGRAAAKEADAFLMGYTNML